MQLKDGRRGYGWVSIALHWVAAVAIIAMLFIGNSTRAPGGGAQTEMLRLHTSLGLLLYPVLWLRIGWRLYFGHPEPGLAQSRSMYRLGGWFHLVLLTATGAMLLSGPLLAWTGGLPLRLGDLTVPNPLGPHPAASDTLRWTHVAAASVLGWGALLHVIAVCKHAMVDRDGAFDRIMVAGEQD